MMTENTKRWVEAPSHQGAAPLPLNALRGVYLDHNEEVEWVWTHADGVSYVSGYRLVGTQDEKE